MQVLRSNPELTTTINMSSSRVLFLCRSSTTSTSTTVPSLLSNKSSFIPAHHLSNSHGSSSSPSLLCFRRTPLHHLVNASDNGHGTFGDPISIEGRKLENVLPGGEDINDTSGHGAFRKWDSTTGKLAGSATVAFLLLQLPQIFLNFQNLSSGNTIALFAVPWMGQLTSLLGNLSLLSYFAMKKEVGAMVVQAVGVVSTWVVLLQLTMAGAMPLPAFTATATAVGLGLLLNLLNYRGLLNSQVWELWEDVITLGGLSVLPQVMWSTFDTILPPSFFPGIVTMVIGLTLISLRRLRKLPPDATRLLGAVSAWTATLLFMWGPVSQMWTNYLNPANIRGLSIYTVLLAMVGNGLLLPRALFTRDRMWFTGASWGTLLQGWGILVTMYLNKCLPDSIFWSTGATLTAWLGFMLVKDSKAHSLPSPLSPLRELFFGPSQKVSAKLQ